MPESQVMMLTGPRSFVPASFPLPQPGADEGLLRVDVAGICGTDLKYFDGSLPLNYPVILGHEITGTIVDAGPQFLNRRGLQVGNRVIVEASVGCGLCDECLSGRYNFCRQRQAYGRTERADVPPHLWGAYSQYLYLAPRAIVHQVPDHVPPEVAVLIGAIIANGFEWLIHQAGMKAGDRVVIQGCGQQGLGLVAAAVAGGAAQVIVTGKSVDRPRFALAQTFGAAAAIDVDEADAVSEVVRFTGGRKADLVADVTGSTDAIVNSLQMVRPGGCLVAAGLTGKGTLTPLPLDQVVYGGIRIQGVFAKTLPSIRRAIDLVASERFPFAQMVTHRYPLHQAERAMQALRRELPGVAPIKVVLDPWLNEDERP